MRTTDTFLPFALPDVTEAEVEAVVATMRSGWLTTGPNTAAFETEFAQALGGGLHAVAVNSATAGLHLAVEALGIGSGDEVLVPTWTFTATAEIVRYLGAKPVFVDVDPTTLNIDFLHAATLVTARTKAIIPVHFAGLPVPHQEVEQFASTHQLHVIEDAAHAFPVLDGERMVGASSSAATVFSFYATKTICTGEGGMLITPDPDLAHQARTMRVHGISRDAFDRYSSQRPSWQYSVVAPGYKYNMTDMAAAMGRVQLARAEEMRLARQRIAERYHEGLRGLPIQLPITPSVPRGHSHYLFVIRVEEDAPVDRDEFIEQMVDLGVGTSVHFIPLHKQPYWRDTYTLRDDDFPVANRAFKAVVSLPIFSSMTTSQVERVINCARTVLTQNAQRDQSAPPQDPSKFATPALNDTRT